jgi:hypothetical protein
MHHHFHSGDTIGSVYGGFTDKQALEYNELKPLDISADSKHQEAQNEPTQSESK